MGCSLCDSFLGVIVRKVHFSFYDLTMSGPYFSDQLRSEFLRSRNYFSFEETKDEK